MAYMTFHKDRKSYEIDLEVMDRIAELQEAVIQLQELSSIDASTLSASLAAWKEREAKLSEELQAYYTELLAQAQELGVSVPTTLESAGTQDIAARIELVESLIEGAKAELYSGDSGMEEP